MLIVIIMFIVFNESLNCFNKIAEIKNKLKENLKKIEMPDKFMPIPELPKTESVIQLILILFVFYTILVQTLFFHHKITEKDTIHVSFSKHIVCLFRCINNWFTLNVH